MDSPEDIFFSLICLIDEKYCLGYIMSMLDREQASKTSEFSVQSYYDNEYLLPEEIQVKFYGGAQIIKNWVITGEIDHFMINRIVKAYDEIRNCDGEIYKKLHLDNDDEGFLKHCMLSKHYLKK